MIEYTSDQLWPLYENLPKDLQKAIFSAENADAVYDICVRNNVEEKASEIADSTGYVLLGLLSPNELEETLKTELSIKPEIAKRINREISRFVFFPVKESLELLYKMEIENNKPVETITPTFVEPLKKDIYREPIE